MIKASGVQVIKISTDLGAAALMGDTTPRSDLTNFTSLFCGNNISRSIVLLYTSPMCIDRSERDSNIDMTMLFMWHIYHDE